jgi:hypothetical protein
MSTPLKVPLNVALTEWVEQAKADPVRYQERQVTEILLHAIGITPALSGSLVLKGGILMSLAHGSFRQTGDVDFTAIVEPQPFAGMLRETINRALPQAAADLGYVDVRCAVQRFEYKPRPQGFEESTAPALKLTIGYARQGTPDEERLKDGKSTRVLQVDISFRETIVHASDITIQEPEVVIQAYDVEEILAEKIRALLQQPIRNRNRRQDVFDINWLITRYQPDGAMRDAVLGSLSVKSADRDVETTRESMDNTEVRERARSEWNTMKLEIGGQLPDFDETFDSVLAFYRSLPWPG